MRCRLRYAVCCLAVTLTVWPAAAAHAIQVRSTGDIDKPYPIAEMSPPVAAFERVVAATRLGPEPSLRVPILMYHQFGTAPTPEAAPYFTDPAAFVEQLRYLQSHGYRAVTLQQVYDHWYGKATLPDNPVVISIDDGNRETFTLVAPLLKSMGWPAVLCLLTGQSTGRTSMDPSQVRALIREGWEIDSHSLNHPDLTTLPAEELARQMSLSKSLLQQEFGVTANFFCYPYGRYTPAVARAAQEAGYLGAVSTVNDVADSRDPYAMKRVFVRGGESIAAFAASLH